METFVTLFDSGYLHHGLALHRSLREAMPDARLLVVAMESRAAAILRVLAPPGLEAVEVDGLGDPALIRLRPGRSRAAFCWSTTPTALLWALDRAGPGGRATYIDADVAVLRTPLPLLAAAERAGAAILATPHATGAVREALFGRYCVQFLTAWERGETRMVLRRWRGEVLAACDEDPLPGRYGDQCRLDRWPRLLGEALAEPPEPLLFAAPWNAAAGARDPLAFHFHQWRLRSPTAWRWVRNHRLPAWTMPIYRSYQERLEAACRTILAVDPAWRPAGIAPEATSASRLKGRLRRKLGWEHDSALRDPDLSRLLGGG